jgi:hypothetical protein
MATGSSPTSPKTDTTSSQTEVTHLSKQVSSKSKSTHNDDQSTTSTDSIQVVQVKSGHGIYSSQPRFYIPAIQSRFQHTKDRFCYKIKVSFPWIDSTVPPTMGTYYTVIQLFFSLVNKHDKNLKFSHGIFVKTQKRQSTILLVFQVNILIYLNTYIICN